MILTEAHGTAADRETLTAALGMDMYLVIMMRNLEVHPLVEGGCVSRSLFMRFTDRAEGLIISVLP